MLKDPSRIDGLVVCAESCYVPLSNYELSQMTWWVVVTPWIIQNLVRLSLQVRCHPLDEILCLKDSFKFPYQGQNEGSVDYVWFVFDIVFVQSQQLQNQIYE